VTTPFPSVTLESLTNAFAGRYRIERELGRGGMATVYLAHDFKHDRKVAIKLLRRDLSSTLGHERFVKEIALTASLQHPHILPLFDSGTADGIADDVITHLATVGGLTVISRTSALAYKGTTKPLKQIAAELGVGRHSLAGALMTVASN
jgi:serine/threonine protein kinase